MEIKRITFIKYYNYDIEMEEDMTEDDAVETAYDLFCNEMRSPIADLAYDEVEVW